MHSSKSEAEEVKEAVPGSNDASHFAVTPPVAFVGIKKVNVYILVQLDLAVSPFNNLLAHV